MSSVGGNGGHAWGCRIANNEPAAQSRLAVFPRGSSLTRSFPGCLVSRSYEEASSQPSSQVLLVIHNEKHALRIQEMNYSSLIVHCLCKIAVSSDGYLRSSHGAQALVVVSRGRTKILFSVAWQRSVPLQSAGEGAPRCKS